MGSNQFLQMAVSYTHLDVYKRQDYAYVAVGSFVFLRFLGPALVSPDSENILILTHTRDKRPFITLAKVIQNMANGADTFVKWPALNGQTELLKECSSKITTFLTELCETNCTIHPEIHNDTDIVATDYDFLHRYLYKYDLEFRKSILGTVKSFDDFKFLKEFVSEVDKTLGTIGQPKSEVQDGIPTFVKEHMEDHPQLYEFMSRSAFRSLRMDRSEIVCVHESISTDGVPVFTMTFNDFLQEGLDLEGIVFKVIQQFSKFWSSSHYLMVDYTCLLYTSDNVLLLSNFSKIVPSSMERIKFVTLSSKYGNTFNRISAISQNKDLKKMDISMATFSRSCFVLCKWKNTLKPSVYRQSLLKSKIFSSLSN